MIPRFSVDTRIEVFPALPEDIEHGHFLHLKNEGTFTVITPIDVAVGFLAYARQVADLVTATADGDHTFNTRYLDVNTAALLHEGDLDPGTDAYTNVTLTATSGSRINVHRAGQQVGHLRWNATSEMWHAVAADDTPIGEHQLRVRAVDLVTDYAQQVMGTPWGWLITRKHADNDDAPVLAGPHNMQLQILSRLERGEGTQFRLRDADGNLGYKGRIIAEDDGTALLFKLLERARISTGCTSIEYLDEKTSGWVEL
ncbi:hypothetical protein OG339_48610 (plasmid) [Streptosporangium sp. NBC_01495]|uniref:hypothetical protein n=1 Tax=Streptosporangium sp. NBC_01495 TaxID=2903899 RepID=UPI002E337784|nr:hypothetical protein [Streptosporangium sp. NBC_01495]